MSKGKHDQVDMLHGPLLGKLVLFALPLALSSILQQLFNAVDIAVLGQFATSQDQAAVGCTSAVINMFLNLFLGISVGANVVIATYIGQRDKEKVQASVHTAMLIALISGFVMMLVGFVTARPILELIQTPESVLDKAVLYLLIYFAGMPFIMVYNFGAAILRSVGDTKRPLICLTVSGVLNAGLNIFLVAVCGMDVDGVAIATVLSNVVSCVVVVWMLCREKSEIRLSLRALRMDRALLGRMLAIGLPAGLQSTVFSLSNVVIQSAVNSFGSTVVAGNSAASNIEGFVYTAMNAFAQAAVTFTSQNMGARRYDNLDRVMRNCLLCAVGIGVLLGGGAFLGGNLLLHFYSTDEAVVAAGLARMRIICTTYFLCGVMDTLASCLRGRGYSVMPMIVSLVGSCLLRLVWIATVFQLFRSTTTLYISYPISWILTALVHFICLMVVRKKLHAESAAMAA